MTVHHMPANGGDDQHFEVIAPGAIEEYATVPLVIYGEQGRKVIGEATIRGSEVHVVLGDTAGEEVMDMLMGPHAEFSAYIGFGQRYLADKEIPKNEFRVPEQYPKKDLFKRLEPERIKLRDISIDTHGAPHTFIEKVDPQDGSNGPDRL